MIKIFPVKNGNSLEDFVISRFGKELYKTFFKDFTYVFKNLFLIGRNGMHEYNNQEHSMLAAITAVDNIISGEKSKENIWNINTDDEYHETKK